MRCFVRSCLTLLLIGCGHSILSAQPSSVPPVLYAITEQQGLSDNRVLCMQNDERGFMWVGTQNGLNCFDGSTIRVFRPGAGASLPGEVVRALREDHHGHLWIGTNKGLACYDEQTAVITSWIIPAGPNEASLNNIEDLLMDGDSTIWIGTTEGLFRFDVGKHLFKSFVLAERRGGDPSRRNNYITKLVLDHQGRFWVATLNGLWRFFPEDGHFERGPTSPQWPPENTSLFSMYLDGQGRLWLGFYNQGPMRYDPVTGVLERFSGPGSGRPTVSGFAELKDPKGNHRLYFSPALREIVTTSRNSVPILEEEDGVVGAMHIGALFVSRDNLLWMGTDHGVRIMDPVKQAFHHLRLSEKMLSSQTVALLPDGKNLYVGGAGDAFLWKFDSGLVHKQRLLPGFKAREGRNEYAPSMIHLAREDKTHLWLCTEKGLVLFDEANGKTHTYFIDSAAHPSRSTVNFITNILIDAEGKHWVFPWRNGIWQVEQASGAFKKIFDGFLTEATGVKELLINEAVDDSLGHIWLADIDEGLIRYDKPSKQFSKPFSRQFGNLSSLEALYYEKPYLWFTPMGYVCRVQVVTGELRQWAIPEPYSRMPDDFSADALGHLWLKSGDGLIRFDKNTHAFTPFTQEDGLPADVLGATMATLPDGQLIYADGNYLIRFNPGDLALPDTTIPARITGLYAQGQPIPVRTNRDGKKAVWLDHTFSNFRLTWAMPFFNPPFLNQYYCRLEGVDRDWKFVGNKGEAQYVSLAPGTYRFDVEARDRSGRAANVTDSLFITIYPPYWKTAWFISSIVALCLGLLYWLYRYRLARALEVERLRTRISADLHDDIGSTLSSISIMSQMMLREKLEGQSGQMAQEIKNNAVSLMEKMDDIVWSINPRNDSLENLLNRIRQFAVLVFRARDMEYSIQFPDNLQSVHLPMRYRQHVYLIMKEAINNLVKHSGASRAAILVYFHHGHLEIEISDNGRGFDPKVYVPGNGMDTMRKRSRAMKAKLDVQSGPEDGTWIWLRVKI